MVKSLMDSSYFFFLNVALSIICIGNRDVAAAMMRNRASKSEENGTFLI